MRSRVRRTTLKLALLAPAVLAPAVLVPACGGGGGSANAEQSNEPDPGPPPPPSPWNPGPLVFVAGGADTIDLAATLPPHVRRGGTFSLAQGSPPLPAGMTLEPDGVLRLGTAPIGAEALVTFAYEEP